MKKLLILTLLLFSIAIQAQTWEAYVKIKRVHDGDGTYYGITENQDTVTIRLRNVDCPEIFSPYVLKTQPYGIEAGNQVRSLIKGKTVYAVCFGKSFNRYVCDITYYEDTLLTKPKDLRTTILKNGWGWYDGKKYGMKIPSGSKFRGGLKMVREARKNCLGLWKYSHPIRPSIWRKTERLNKKQKGVPLRLEGKKPKEEVF